MKWTTEELESLRSHYASEAPDPMAFAESHGRTITSVKVRASKLGIISSRRSLKKDIEYIKSLNEIKNIKEIATFLGRTWITIKRIIDKLKIKSYAPYNLKWNPTPEEIDIMKAPLTLNVMSEKLNRANATILKKINQMGLCPLKNRREKKKKIPRIPKAPRVKRIVMPNKMIEVRVERNNLGISRIREAMERINKI